MLNVVIIEDEKLTALDLSNTLNKIDSDIKIVAILGSVKKAIEFFQTEKDFHLIFADIQLPDGLSFEIFRNTKILAPVIFCTAYDQYALEAFEVNGIDYLLKPFDKASVSKALDKYQVLKSEFTQSDKSFNALLQLLEQQKPHQMNSIIVQKGERIIPLEGKDIAMFHLENENVYAVTFELNRYVVSQNLEEIEAGFGLHFFRANRQFLINRKAVKEASRYLNRKLLIHLNIPYSERILVGKLKTSLFLDWLAKN